jgi:hypothetical protein
VYGTKTKTVRLGGHHDCARPANAVVLRQHSAATDALVAELRAVISDLRQDRDHWREQAQRLLPASKPAQPVEQPMSWWRWLRSTG